MQIRYCTKCGAPNPQDAKYCTRCGAEMPDIEELEEYSKELKGLNEEEKTEEKVGENVSGEEKAEEKAEETEKVQSALPVHAEKKEEESPEKVENQLAVIEKHEEKAKWREKLDALTAGDAMTITSIALFTVAALMLIFASPLKSSEILNDLYITMHTIRSMTLLYIVQLFVFAYAVFINVWKEYLDRDNASLINSVLSIAGLLTTMCALNAVIAANGLLDAGTKTVIAYQFVDAFVFNAVTEKMLHGYFFLMSAAFLATVMCIFNGRKCYKERTSAEKKRRNK